jgi:hypothetical protein
VVTNALSHSAGTVDEKNDSFILWSKGRTKVSAQIFKVAPEMLSGPGALVTFMFDSSSKSKDSFNSISSK